MANHKTGCLCPPCKYRKRTTGPKVKMTVRLEPHIARWVVQRAEIFGVTQAEVLERVVQYQIDLISASRPSGTIWSEAPQEMPHG